MKKDIKILMVDDERDFTQPMAFWFQRKGYEVVIASSGEEALSIIKEECPAIIFLDLNMPVMDGLETLKRIREIDTQVPVVIVSAYADPRKIKEIQPLGISGVFYKGKDFDEGVSLLESILRTHKKLK
jgi:two-component system response regulator (stage 0 sporulation protein F)